MGMGTLCGNKGGMGSAGGGTQMQLGTMGKIYMPRFDDLGVWEWTTVMWGR